MNRRSFLCGAAAWLSAPSILSGSETSPAEASRYFGSQARCTA